MSRRWQTCLLCSASIALLVFATKLILVSRASTKPSLPANAIIAKKTVGPDTAQSPGPPRLRNLSLQPEAFKLSRRLGRRLGARSRDVTSAVGNLITGAGIQPLSINRVQTDLGERVEIAKGTDVLMWSHGEGFMAVGRQITEAERILLERLTFDSPDQFVLAQLRGAAYHTVARNVRGDEGGSEDYRGPLWDVIRVDEPETDDATRPLSSGRLYYINVRSGLLDKIVTEFRGEKIETTFLDWMEQSGEHFPSRIVWRRGEQTLLEFRLTTLARQLEP